QPTVALVARPADARKACAIEPANQQDLRPLPVSPLGNGRHDDCSLPNQEDTMEPYRNSWSARLVWSGISMALIGGVLMPAWSIDPGVALPIVLLVSVAACIVGLVLGAHAHTGPVALLAI